VLKGHTVEIRGKIKDYKGQPEIVITSREQIKSDALIPELPDEFGADRDDATNLGQYPRSRRDRAW
jgi:DNA/RNA endonuclease YhcR with UshA esterase domain